MSTASPRGRGVGMSRTSLGRPRSASATGRAKDGSLPKPPLAARLDRLGAYVTAAVVALCPLPFGSVDKLWIALWCVPLAVALVLFDTRRLTASHVAMLAPVLVFAAFIGAVVWLQLLPDTSLVAPHPIWAQAADVLKEPLPATATIDPVSTWAALGRPILMLLAFCCAFLAATDREGAALIFRVAAFSGAAYAAYGIIANLVDPTTLLGQEKFAYVGDLTSTFVNRNTAATFLGCCLILWFVRLLTELDRRVPKSNAGVRDFGAALVDQPSRKLVIAVVCVTFTLAALLMTRSRAGTLITFGCLFITATLFLRHRMAGRSGMIAGVGGLLLVAVLALEFLGGAVAVRIGSQGLVDEGRLAVYRSAVVMIRDYPLLGTGLGTFTEAFPAYRDPSVNTMGTWEHAHNTMLEIALELGLPAAVAVVLLWFAGLARLLQGSLQRRRDAGFSIAAFGIGLLGCLHSAVDFSPQIPGFGVFWVAILGAGLAQTVSRSEATAGPGMRPSAVAA